MSVWLSPAAYFEYDDIRLNWVGGRRGGPPGRTVPGIFIFSNEDPSSDSGFRPIFIGQAEDVQRAASMAAQRGCVSGERPTHINIRYEPSEGNRQREVAAIRDRYGSRCN